MVMLPLSQVDFSDKIELEEIVDSGAEILSGMPFDLQQQFTRTFIEDVNYFENKRPVDISIGYYHSCVVFDDGSLECSGYDAYGSLGLGYNTQPTHTGHLQESQNSR